MRKIKTRVNIEEAHTITLTLPDDIPLGEHELTIIVDDKTSNKSKWQAPLRRIKPRKDILTSDILRAERDS